MFPLTPDQHHWLDVATEDEGWCSFTSCTPSRSRARTYRDWITKSSVLSIGRCNNTKFQQNWLITFAVIMYIDRQNEWQTNPTDRIICALAEKVIRTLRAPNKTIVINYSTYKMLTPGKKNRLKTTRVTYTNITKQNNQSAGPPREGGSRGKCTGPGGPRPPQKN